MIGRIFRIVRKEILQISRDKGLVGMVAIAPVLQLLIYGYVVATEIRALPVVILDRSNSEEARRLMERFTAGGYFTITEKVDSLDRVTEHLDSGRSIAALVIPVDFAKDLRRGSTAEVQMLVDGTNSNTATIAMGYASGILTIENDSLLKKDIDRRGFRLIAGGVRAEPRVWFNPSLRPINYMVPGIVCVLLMEMMVPLTAFSIVRERERGTIEQLMVTPVRATEMLIGKTIPYVLLGLADVLLIVGAGTFWFQVPISGSMLSLLAAAALFIVVSLGLGILIATLVHTQQQGTLAAQFALVPNILLSGFMFPIESMPQAMQYFTAILPMRYFLVIVRGIFMKGLGLWDMWGQIVPLAIIGAIVFSISWLRFRKVFG
jgi:ABC-2 type transport system permease protein